MATLKVSVGHEEGMTTALLSLAALQGHVTRLQIICLKHYQWIIRPPNQSHIQWINHKNNWINSLKDKWKSSNYVLMKSK